MVLALAVVLRVGFWLCGRGGHQHTSRRVLSQRPARTVESARGDRHGFAPADLDDVVAPLDAVHLFRSAFGIGAAEVCDETAEFPAADRCELARIESGPHDLREGPNELAARG